MEGTHRRMDALVEVINQAMTMVANSRELGGEATALLDRLKKTIDAHGVATTEACLTLVPIAQAKGDSRAEVDLMLDRFDRGLMANAFITLNPSNKRFPCEVVGTGRVVPPGIELPATTRKTG